MQHLTVLKKRTHHEQIILLSRGLVQTELGTLDAALDDFSSVLSLSPNDARAYNNRAITLQKCDKKAEAVADLEKALDLDPAYLNAALNLINHYSKYRRNR